MEYKVTMPYIGGILSDNNYKIGKTKKKTRPIVVLWMNELSDKVSKLEIPQAGNYGISLWGKFWDERRPDLANLHKVIGDALQKGLAVNDKTFFFVDKGYELGIFEMELEITIRPITEESIAQAIRDKTYVGVETGRIVSEFLNILEVSKDNPDWTTERTGRVSE